MVRGADRDSTTSPHCYKNSPSAAAVYVVDVHVYDVHFSVQSVSLAAVTVTAAAVVVVTAVDVDMLHP